MLNSNAYFKTRYTYSKDRDKVWKAIASYLQKYISSSDVVLDVGAGYCDMINNIVCKERHALDIFRQLRSYAADGIHVHIGSCTKMNLKTNYFDVVFASNLFEHLNEREFLRAISEVKRVLKKHGRLIVIQPNFRYANREYFDDYTHRAVFTHISFSDILSGYGFEIIRIVPRFLPFSMNSRFPKSTLLTKIYLAFPLKLNASQFLIVAEKREQ